MNERAEMAPKYTIDNPGRAARSIERWFPKMFGVEITARQVQAYWQYNQEFQDQQRAAGKPFTNFTGTFDNPSQVAIDCAEFLTGKGVPTRSSQIQALWIHHKAWQSSPERRAERGQEMVKPPPQTSADAYFILNQGAMDANTEPRYDDVEGQRYHWTMGSSGATRKLSESAGARFVYYRTGSATDGTAQCYFGHGKITEVQAQGDRGFVATIDDYHRFEQPVPSAEGPNKINHTNSISVITQQDFEMLIRLGSGEVASGGELTLDGVRNAVTKAGLELDDAVLTQLLAALLSEKHVILTGPPGTAKTTLAQAVADAAQTAGLCAGFMPTTATADWTTYETIGGLRPKGADKLVFEEGHFLQAIRKNQWLLIDELNRSQFDRAFGQLFTVLSGQPVVLPYARPDADNKPLVLLPTGAESPIPDGDVLQIPEDWRIIATMNVFDKSLLFEMSFALMRRFAFIEVASPPLATFEQLIDDHAVGETKAATLAKQLLALREMKDLGPAVFIDLTKFLRERITLQPAEDGQLLFEAFYSYLLPQFEGIDVPTGDELFKVMSRMVGSGERKDRLRRTLNSVLGLELLRSSTNRQDEMSPDDTLDFEEP